MANLPKGKKNQKARMYVYEEKNTLLTRGKRKNQFGIRGGDGRMGYVSDAEKVLNIVVKWVRNNGTAADIFNTLREINVKNGYGTGK